MTDLKAIAARILERDAHGTLFAYGMSGDQWSAWVRPEDAKDMIAIVKLQSTLLARDELIPDLRDRKHLDPECYVGCQSLRWKQALERIIQESVSDHATDCCCSVCEIRFVATAAITASESE